jgi:hypothetical protein
MNIEKEGGGGDEGPMIRRERSELCCLSSQNHWLSGLGPSSGIVNARKHNASETGSISVLR